MAGARRITDAVVRKLPPPGAGNSLTFDTAVKGFAVRVTAAGARSFILNYRTKSGRQRRYTIGSSADWKASQAREEAKRLKRIVDGGGDPLAEVEADREAPTVADLARRFGEEHLPRTRPATQSDYQGTIDRYILPALGGHKVAEVSFEDIDRLHRKITRDGWPIRANRAVAVLSKMFNLAIRWKMRADNPARGIDRNLEHKRRRYLSADELVRLTRALNKHEDQEAANIVRLLLFTGARRGEVLAMRWDQLNLQTGTWSKPASMTKQKAHHDVPLSAPARALLSDLQKTAQASARKRKRPMSAFVFPGRNREGTPHRVEMKGAWSDICHAAGIVTKQTVKGSNGKDRVVITHSLRMHDLRHSFASLLAGGGSSLPVIGALLGHSQPQTTARYAHLADDPLRQATDRVGAMIQAAADPESVSAEVVPLRKRTR